MAKLRGHGKVCRFVHVGLVGSNPVIVLKKTFVFQNNVYGPSVSKYCNLLIIKTILTLTNIYPNDFKFWIINI